MLQKTVPAAGGQAAEGGLVKGGAQSGERGENFRPNVGLLLADGRGRVLFAERSDGLGWQLPQGGIAAGETAEQAMYRELGEELGLAPQDVQLIAGSSRWFSYRVPDKRRALYPRLHKSYIGQRQRWFLLHFLAADDKVRLDLEEDAEFSDWRWVHYWYPLRQVVDFKREAYRRMLRELCAAHTHLCRMRQRGGTD